LTLDIALDLAGSGLAAADIDPFVAALWPKRPFGG